MVADLQPGDVVIAKKIDRISRLPLTEAERLVATIRARRVSCQAANKAAQLEGMALWLIAGNR